MHLKPAGPGPRGSGPIVTFHICISVNSDIKNQLSARDKWKHRKPKKIKVVLFQLQGFITFCKLQTKRCFISIYNKSVAENSTPCFPSTRSEPEERNVITLRQLRLINASGGNYLHVDWTTATHKPKHVQIRRSCKSRNIFTSFRTMASDNKTHLMFLSSGWFLSCSDSSGRQLERDMLDLKRPQDVSLSLFLSTGLKKCSNSSYLQALQYCTFLHTTLTKSDTSKSRSSSARLQNETVRGARRKRSKYSSCWGETSTERLFGDVGLKEDKTINYWARKTTYLKWAQ